MNSTTTNIIISSISSVGTVAAAIIYFRTLKELKKQGANTYKPHLFIDNSYFNVNAVKKNNITMPSKWTNSRNSQGIEEYIPEEFHLKRFGLKCYNIGFGTATKVSIKFSIEIKKFIDRMKILEDELSEDNIIDIENIGMFISFKPKNKNLPYSSLGINRELELNRDISYILPVSISNTFSVIELPSHFLELLNIYIFYLSVIEQTKKTIKVDFPVITAIMNYTDIANIAVRKSLSIRIELEWYGPMGYAGQFIVIEGE